ncbi:hypothetical protein F5Y11DRAFT_347795 [Daldinia sp. FL1419]|nr:hypothetical protein F5Y11DRAFT_347795 [Daldinia sp. FL1419]
MSSRDQSLSSNNPFRRKLGYPSLSTDGPASAPASSFNKPLDPIPRTPFTTFKSTPPGDDERKMREGGEREKEATPLQPKPKKVVKRVRVQSPPPSSPEDTVPVSRFPSVSDGEDDEDDGYKSDDSNLPDYLDHVDSPDTDSATARDQDSSRPGRLEPPANPFAKTLEDLEQPGQEQSTKTKGALDVDSFKRLLLTGHANIPSHPSASAPELGGDLRVQSSIFSSEASTDSYPRSRRSIFDTVPKETPRSSPKIYGSEDPREQRGILPTSSVSSIPPSSTRKKPPPPSSRHGKLIKIELGEGIESHTTKSSPPPVSINVTALPSSTGTARKSNSHAGTPLQSPLLATDVNKPLPLTPFRPSVEEAVDSPFDREAIGKVPEPFIDPQPDPEPPIALLAARAHIESNGTTQSRKPVAPPPPRRHGRSDSRAPSINTTNVDEDTPPRSSLESNRSRADSLRTNTNLGNPNIPAPPPPRRPNHVRQGSSFTNPSQSNFALASPIVLAESERAPTGASLGHVSKSGQIETAGSLATITTNKDGLPKLSPPPPPPTRQASTRRPPSVRSIDLGNGSSAARRVSKEKDGVLPPPPPPPPRQRGSSRASVESSVVPVESTRNTSDDTQKDLATSTETSVSKATDKQGEEILADLDALQREVDALMGRYGKASGS